MKVSLRLSDADREKWGGDEWTHIDIDKLPDLGYDRLRGLESEIRRHDGTSIAKILGVEWPDLTFLGIRGIAWLARQLSGLTEPAWAEFKPDIINLEQKIVRGGANPPAGGSSEPPSDKTAPAKTARLKKDSAS